MTKEWKTQGRAYGDDELGKTILIDYPLHIVNELNENFMGVVIGMPGKGKTWAAARLAEQLDPTFDISRVCVSYKEFLTVMKTLSDAWLAGEKVSGKVVIFDEFQQSASARKWQSNVNTAINDVLHTFRFMNLIVIFTTPHMSFIDVNARAVMHFQIIMKRKHIQMGLSEATVNFTSIKNDPRDPSDKLYSFAPRLFTEAGVVRVNKLFFRKPSKPMQKAIDLKVNTFKRAVLDAAILKADSQQKLDEEVKKSSAELSRDFANDIFEQKIRYLDPQTKKWDVGAILLDYPEISSSKMTTIRKMLVALSKRSIKD